MSFRVLIPLLAFLGIVFTNARFHASRYEIRLPNGQGLSLEYITPDGNSPFAFARRQRQTAPVTYTYAGNQRVDTRALTPSGTVTTLTKTTTNDCQQECTKKTECVGYEMNWDTATCRIFNELAYPKCGKLVGDREVILYRKDDTAAAEAFCQAKKGVHFEGYCYLFDKTPVDWKTAKANCEAKQTKLAVITSDRENSFVHRMMTKVLTPGEINEYYGGAWIGLTDVAQEGVFVTTEGTKAQYGHWEPGNPNNQDGLEHCAGIMYKKGEWNDYKCYVKLGTVCMSPI